MNQYFLLNPFIPMPEHFPNKQSFFFHHISKTLIMGATIVLIQLMILLVGLCLHVCRIMQQKTVQKLEEKMIKFLQKMSPDCMQQKRTKSARSTRRIWSHLELLFA